MSLSQLAKRSAVAWCEQRTPFGTPVEPDVKVKYAGAAGDTCGSGLVRLPECQEL